jgi:hypothetical protein
MNNDAPDRSPPGKSDHGDSTRTGISWPVRIVCILGFWATVIHVILLGFPFFLLVAEKQAFYVADISWSVKLALAFWEDARIVLGLSMAAGLIAAYGFDRARAARPAAKILLLYVVIRFLCAAAALAAAFYLMSLESVTVPDPQSGPGGCYISFYPVETIRLTLYRELLLSVPLPFALAILLLVRGKRGRMTHFAEPK